tara:strand:+ start:10400 stop:10543 length:144 start_codon:yes stop_codon:yes gene_type:complete
MEILTMEQLITKLKEIDRDFYNGVYTVGEFYDLKNDLTEVLINKKFI